MGALVHNAGSVLVILNSAFLLRWQRKNPLLMFLLSLPVRNSCIAAPDPLLLDGLSLSLLYLHGQSLSSLSNLNKS